MKLVWTSGYPTFVRFSNSPSMNLVQGQHASRLLFESGVPLLYLPGYYIGEAELRARIGFFFDQNRHLWDIDDSSLDPFRPSRWRDGARHHLDPATLRPCRFVKEWNLEVPVDVFERWWEEFH